jgi:hypothetical protein
MAIKQYNQPNKPLHGEYSIIHSRNSKSSLKRNDLPVNNSTSMAFLESISRYYGYLNYSEENNTNLNMNQCFAVRLACFLIEAISNNKFMLDSQGYFRNNFYQDILEKASASELAVEIGDTELLIIYIKQCLRMLKASGILRQAKACADINQAAVSSKSIYSKLFNAFWNDVPWEDIFPSDTESARELKVSKNILKDLILRHHGFLTLQSVTNEFFDMTGFCAQNDLLKISFIDFYFFTWLKHFGMIRYFNGADYAPVRIAVTDKGRIFLNSI